ncbi:MAG: hypothetical protein KDA41_12275, partial [Planctomycetales bacterium]|nr:hypothetical protein [Planctomycetales bacterium]
ERSTPPGSASAEGGALIQLIDNWARDVCLYVGGEDGPFDRRLVPTAAIPFLTLEPIESVSLSGLESSAALARAAEPQTAAAPAALIALGGAGPESLWLWLLCGAAVVWRFGRRTLCRTLYQRLVALSEMSLRHHAPSQRMRLTAA